MSTRNHLEFLFAHIFSVIVLFVLFAAGTNISTAQTGTHAAHVTVAVKPADIVRDPTDVPVPLPNRAATVVHITLTARELVGTLDTSANTTYRYWTFNGKVPGPMIRVRQGDTVEVTLQNDPSSRMAHSIDFHAALGPGGGAALSQTVPGQSKTFTFQATTPGLFVYHCGTQMIAEHMANGMYGLILVEPENGLPHVDHEYYVMQGEIYTAEPKGKEGLQQFSAAKLMDERPEYSVFNGAVDSLTTQHPMPAKVGETIRVFFGNAGPNQTSSTHVVGEILTHVYQFGSLTSPPLDNVQTVTVPPGAAAILELSAKIPGKFALMDHAISRMAKGNMAIFDVTGPENTALMHAGPVSQQDASQAKEERITGMTSADENSNSEGSAAATKQMPSRTHTAVPGDMDMGGMMNMAHPDEIASRTKQGSAKQQSNASSAPEISLNGCLTLASDGKAMLNVFQSSKVYRLEAQPLLFSQNANRLVHITGHFGSVMTVEDPRLPSFVVSTVDQIVPNCNEKVTRLQIQRILIKQTEATSGVVGMNDLGFVPQTIVVNVGEKITWKNSSSVTHNVIGDPSQALYKVDVRLPSGVRPFGSSYLQPGQSFSHEFNVPGTYHYVCTLHENLGMKGVIIVRAPQVLRAGK